MQGVHLFLQLSFAIHKIIQFNSDLRGASKIEKVVQGAPLSSTYSNFILSGYSAGLVLIIIRIGYSMAASMASDYVEPQFYSHTPNMIGTGQVLVLFSKYFYTKIYEA